MISRSATFVAGGTSVVYEEGYRVRVAMEDALATKSKKIHTRNGSARKDSSV